MLTALVGLLGAVIGAGIGLAASWIETGHATKVVQRRDLLDVFTRFASLIEGAREAKKDSLDYERRIAEARANGAPISEDLANSYRATLEKRIDAFREWKQTRHQILILASPLMRAVTRTWDEDLENDDDFVNMAYLFDVVARRDTSLSRTARRQARGEIRKLLAVEEIRAPLALWTGDVDRIEPGLSGVLTSKIRNARERRPGYRSPTSSSSTDQ